jgi:hypothetical protein
MAGALSADRLLSALRAEGLRVVEYRDWRTHRRPSSAGTFGEINGVMIHHTVTSGTTSSVELCYNGHSSLPGPLCHGVIAKDGTVYLVSNGRANHAGLGDDDVLRAVQDESYDRDRLLVPNEANTDGNSRFYGFECINLGNGTDPWPEAQRDAIVRASAAILRAYGGPAQGWTARSVIGHKEWQPGKVDPRTGTGGVDVSPPVLRRLIDDRLAHSASWNPNAPSEEDDMTPEQSKQLAELAAAVKRIEAGRRVDPWLYKGDGEPRDMHQVVKDIDHGVRAFEPAAMTEEQVDRLAAAVVEHPALADAIADKLAARLAN